MLTEITFERWDREKITVQTEGHFTVYSSTTNGNGKRFHMVAVNDIEAFNVLKKYTDHYLRNMNISSDNVEVSRTAPALKILNSELLPTIFLNGSMVYSKK